MLDDCGDKENEALEPGLVPVQVGLEKVGKAVSTGFGGLGRRMFCLFTQKDSTPRPSIVKLS